MQWLNNGDESGGEPKEVRDAAGDMEYNEEAVMLRITMDTTRVSDVDSHYSYDVIDALSAAGVNAISSVLMVTRPFCEYPCAPKCGPWNERWWERFESVVEYCNNCGLGLQLDLFNEPSLRPGNPLCLPAADPNFVRKTPTGAWARWCQEYIRRVVPIANRIHFGAILYVLEGTNSKAFEMWCHAEAKAAGLKDSLFIVSNSVKNVPGVIYSPHVHSIAAVREHARRGAYLSDDGWYPLNEKKLVAAVRIARDKGCAAYETLLGGCLSGEQPLDAAGEPTGGRVPYNKRKRPSIDQLRRGIVGRMIRALCK